MKRFILITCTFMLSAIGLVLAGCSNQSKTLARNLDDTVTNLIYSISSLDWANSDIIDKINSQDTLDSKINTINGYNNSNYQQNDYYLNNNLYNTNNNQCNNENLYNNQIIDNRSLVNYPTINSEESYNLLSRVNNYNQLNNNDNLTLKENQSGYKTRSRLSRQTKSHINSQYSKTQINNINSANIGNISSFSDNINSNNVNYSTENIEETTKEIGVSITNLINKRADILMQVNALYNGTLNLDEEKIKAINAYINIIKDNTSYLNSNKGLINNQLNQAYNIKTTNNFSPLINAYIIRTNEALQTRLAKLDACIEAIDSILEILDSNNDIDNIIDNYNINNSANYPNNLYNEDNIQNELNNKIIIKNKNANNDNIMQNTDYNLPSLDNNIANNLNDSSTGDNKDTEPIANSTKNSTATPNDTKNNINLENNAEPESNNNELLNNLNITDKNIPFVNTDCNEGSNCEVNEDNTNSDSCEENDNDEVVKTSAFIDKKYREKKNGNNLNILAKTQF